MIDVVALYNVYIAQMHKRDNDFFFSGNFLGGAILERSYGFIGQKECTCTLRIEKREKSHCYGNKVCMEKSQSKSCLLLNLRNVKVNLSLERLRSSQNVNGRRSI